ncbi:MAG: acetamidase/formamidase family protein, partial [Yaniella sp.]|nr:acetamidase/formamidase family protein [Yaniella sp.]
MLGNIFPLDSSKPFTAQEKTGHNRYHPEIPPVETVRPGD